MVMVLPTTTCGVDDVLDVTFIRGGSMHVNNSSDSMIFNTHIKYGHFSL